MRNPSEIKINNKTLKTILEEHLHWISEDIEGWTNMSANLCGANLRDADIRGADIRGANLRVANLCGANLRDANLRDADIRGANLRVANLCVANLRGADLYGANLRDANLYGVNLRGANLCGANLCGADLRDADLYGANLRDANLCGANLRDADLRGADIRVANLRVANLCGANLRDANLRNADIRGADLRGADNIPYIPLACPSYGAFIGWKKVDDLIIKLQIPEDAKRCSATTNKCRCDKALVLEIQNKDGSVSFKNEIINLNFEKCVYTVGEMVYPDFFDEDRWNECSHGIHFFIDREDAVKY